MTALRDDQQPKSTQNDEYDTVIRGAAIVDGSGSRTFKADIGIKNGRITKIGSIDVGSSISIIEAKGLVVSPGFIDVHSHSDITLIVNPKAESKIRQGVTTELVGNCGGSAAPIKSLAINQEAKRYGIKADWRSFSQYFEKLEEGSAVNVASLVGHGTIRQCVIGMEDRAPTPKELEDMKMLVDEAMRDGAFGISSGLVYPPGRYANTSELIELCHVVAKYGGLYASHIRGERETILDALKEAIEIGERSGVSVQISHHPAKIGAWGKSVQTLTMMDEASKRDVKINCDLHPYIGGSTSLSALLPPWAQAGGPAKILERLKKFGEREKIKVDMLEEKIPGPGPCGLVKRGMWDKILISSYPEEWPIGRSIGEIAIEAGADPFTIYFDLLMGSGAIGSVVGFYYNEEDIRNVLRHPRSMIGSDGYSLAPYGILGSGRNHPRSYGTFPMVLRKYVRGLSRSELVYDEAAKILSLEEAVMKMTSIPAEKFMLVDRGLIKVGYWADIAIFNSETVTDTASYLDPYKYPIGIEHVLVNGVSVIRDGEHTGSLPGKVLRFYSKKTKNCKQIFI